MRRSLLMSTFLLLACPAKDDVDPTDADTDTDTDTDSDTDTDTDSDTDADTDPDPCLVDPATLQVGSSELEYGRPDDDEIWLVHGPQGGWHFWGSVQACHFGQRVRVEYNVYDQASGTRIGGLPSAANLALADYEECCGEYPGMFGYVDDVAFLAHDACVTPPQVLEGRTVCLEMHVWNDFGDDETESYCGTVVLDPVDTSCEG